MGELDSSRVAREQGKTGLDQTLDLGRQHDSGTNQAHIDQLLGMKTQRERCQTPEAEATTYDSMARVLHGPSGSMDRHSRVRHDAPGALPTFLAVSGRWRWASAALNTQDSRAEPAENPLQNLHRSQRRPTAALLQRLW